MSGYEREDPQVRRYINELNFYIIPVLNPDGFEFSRSDVTPQVIPLFREDAHRSASGGRTAGRSSARRIAGTETGAVAASTSTGISTSTGAVCLRLQQCCIQRRDRASTPAPRSSRAFLPSRSLRRGTERCRHFQGCAGQTSVVRALRQSGRLHHSPHILAGFLLATQEMADVDPRLQPSDEVRPQRHQRPRVLNGFAKALQQEVGRRAVNKLEGVFGTRYKFGTGADILCEQRAPGRTLTQILPPAALTTGRRRRPMSNMFISSSCGQTRMVIWRCGVHV